MGRLRIRAGGGEGTQRNISRYSTSSSWTTTPWVVRRPVVGGVGTVKRGGGLRTFPCPVYSGKWVVDAVYG